MEERGVYMEERVEHVGQLVHGVFIYIKKPKKLYQDKLVLSKTHIEGIWDKHLRQLENGSVTSCRFRKSKNFANKMSSHFKIPKILQNKTKIFFLKGW